MGKIPDTTTGSAGYPLVVSNADGRLEVFAFDTAADGSGQTLWHSWQLAPGTNDRSTWARFGQPAGGITSVILSAGQNADGRFELFVTDAHAALWHSRQLAPGKNWSEWTSLGKPSDLQLDTWPVIPSPMVAENADGRLEVFLAGQTTFWHIWQP